MLIGIPVFTGKMLSNRCENSFSNAARFFAEVKNPAKNIFIAPVQLWKLDGHPLNQKEMPDEEHQFRHQQAA
jgi:hypothetical protein